MAVEGGVVMAMAVMVALNVSVFCHHSNAVNHVMNIEVIFLLHFVERVE